MPSRGGNLGNFTLKFENIGGSARFEYSYIKKRVYFGRKQCGKMQNSEDNVRESCSFYAFFSPRKVI